jgi:cellulose synthase/poly-beta-1,6-N-acetylglucosamine synthase-like glycosyltransferase
MAIVPSLIPRPQTPKIGLKSFIIPARHPRSHFEYERARICVIIPTYTPSTLTRKLVDDILRWNPNIFVYVVDDSTPKEHSESALFFRGIVSISPRVTVLHTSVNKLKAGALNYALHHIYGEWKEYVPEVILTVDDDVVIDQTTIRNLVIELMSHHDLGAVCSQCRVFNKNKNILTRLQGLEYLGFNAIRLADEGFLRGPLVMHGMLTAFRASALRDVGGFTEGHLIEDYEVTTRLKARGWSVKSAPNARAWTVVPETLAQFWRQRTRWSYGGVTVVTNATHPSSVFQDLLGHAVFLSTIGMVLLLMFSKGTGVVPYEITRWIVVLSLVQLGVWYAFQLWLMRSYREKDLWDWIIRASLVPEFIYSYAMTFALIGSYLFLSFNLLVKNVLATRGGSRGAALVNFGSRFFGACGYTEKRWGTRALL